MIFSRNLGLINSKDQERLRKATVLIAGVGGMGGVAAEVLVRLGVGKLVLCDMDIFEDVNFNRQIHSNLETVGKYKVEVLKEEFLKINPELEISVCNKGINLDTVDSLLDAVDIVVNGMDQMLASLILERNARKKNITIVDAWLTPYASVFVMKADSPHWEEFLDLPTLNIKTEDLTIEICNEAVFKEVQYTLSHFTPFDHISNELVSDVLNGKSPRPSLAPVVWLSGVLMANEVMKLILNMNSTDHKGIFFDQYNYEIVRGNLKLTKKSA